MPGYKKNQGNRGELYPTRAPDSDKMTQDKLTLPTTFNRNAGLPQATGLDRAARIVKTSKDWRGMRGN